MGAGHPVLCLASRALRRVFHRGSPPGLRRVRRPVLRPHVRRDGRLPPLLLAPHVPDEPRVPVRARLPRADERRRRARSGGPRITATTTSTRTRRRTRTRSATTASGTRTSAGSSRARPRTPTTRRSRDLARYPELRWLNKWHVVAGRRARRRRLWLIARLVGARLGLLRLDARCSGTARSRSTRSRTCSARRRYATTRRQQEQPRPRAHHDGRGLAQQPPLLPALDAPGLLLVGDRHHLLHPARCSRPSASSGTSRRRRSARTSRRTGFPRAAPP